MFARKSSANFRALLAEAVDVAQDLFRQGLPLVEMVDWRLSLDLDLFSRGGMKILQKIRLDGYDVLTRRPSVSKAERVGILMQSIRRLLPI